MDAVTSLVVLALALAVVALLLGVLMVLDRRAFARERQAHRRELAAQHEREVALVAQHHGEQLRLQAELSQLEQKLQESEAAERVITAVIAAIGTEVEAPAPVSVSNQVVLSAAVGEPIVKSLALVHGVRRALSPQVRSRIAFEIKQGTKQARKDRRRDMRAAWRAMRRERQSS